MDPRSLYVRALRDLLGYTLEELAVATGVSRAYVHQIENGLAPSAKFVEALSSATLTPKTDRVYRGVLPTDSISIRINGGGE